MYKRQLLASLLRGLAAKHPDLVEGERGQGLLRGIILKKGVDAREALSRIREAGVLLTIAGGQVLRFTPPLIVTDREIEEAVRRVDDCLKTLRIALVADAPLGPSGEKPPTRPG